MSVSARWEQSTSAGSLTQSHAAVLQQVAQVVKHGFLVLTADPTEVAQETAAAGHHLREGNFLRGTKNEE